MPFARIGADGTFTVLEFKEKSFDEQIWEGFTGILENNKIKFQNGIEIYSENNEYSLESFFPIAINFDYLTIFLALSNNKINMTSAKITQIQEEYYLNGILSNYVPDELLPIIFKNREQTIYLSYKVLNETPGYTSLITHTVSSLEPTQTYATVPEPSTPIFPITQLISNSISIGTSRTECNNLTESSEQIPDYDNWINHIKIGDPTHPTQLDYILFSKDFLDSNGYNDETVISLQDNWNNSISFIRQGDTFSNIELNISNLNTSDFYISYVLFPHKESHANQFYLYGYYNSPMSVLAPDKILPSLTYTYNKTENGKDIYGISNTSMIVLKAAWVLRPIYLSIVSGGNILCNQLVESYKQTYEVYEPQIVNYKLSDSLENNYVKIGINNLIITLSFVGQTNWRNWKFYFSTSNSNRQSEVVFCIEIPTKGPPIITKGQRFSDWESTSDIQIKGIIGTSHTQSSIGIRVEKNNIRHEYVDINKNSDYIYDISSNPINIEQEDRWYRSLSTID